MSQLILGHAYEPGRGMCLVEESAPSLTTVILRPRNDPDSRLVRNRAAIQWRRNPARRTP